MDDLISRQAAIDNLISFLQLDGEYAWGIRECLNALPSARPDLDEWCTDCKEYDQERHCCPRWNRVIRNTLKDAQPEPRWIPCEEALPNKNGFYEVTVGASYKPVRIYEYKPCDLYENENRWKSEDGCYVLNWFVEAWRECPKPYERSEDGQ